MVGKQLGSVKGALGDKEDKEDKKDGADEEDEEIAEAKREAEEKRKEKYRKMEEEREQLRQSIRDKYGIKKKIPQDPSQDPGLEGRLGRKKKTPEELAAEASMDMDDSSAQNSVFPKNLDDLTSKVTDLPGKMIGAVSGVTDRCTLQ